MKRRIALFANASPGLEIAKFLDNTDEIVLLFLAGHYPDIDEKIRSSIPNQKNVIVLHGDIRQDLARHTKIFKESNIDALITVYWPHLLPLEIIEICDLTVNFHPALLPINKGWYPHVFNILEHSTAGVTLHELSQEIDGGNIWVQKKVDVFPWECAGDLYLRLQIEIVELFKKNWTKIKNREIETIPQEKSKSSYNHKSKIDSLDKLDLNEKKTIGQIIDLLRTRTFGNKGYAYYEIDGLKISVRLTLEKID